MIHEEHFMCGVEVVSIVFYQFKSGTNFLLDWASNSIQYLTISDPFIIHAIINTTYTRRTKHQLKVRHR